ncbi:MAG TPA: alpha/beta hydrolase [Kofleriaceae bacterium]|nr:alpha/beta hydrolase [Kofleriaceae bacterium]
MAAGGASGAGFHHAWEYGMAVRSRGGGSRTLVWIHGLGESGRCFDAIARHAALSPYRHVIPDLPGYGRSPWPLAPRSLDETADELAVWLTSRADDAVLIGHSLGGVLATVCLERHPQAARAIVDVDGNCALDDCTFSRRLAAFAEEDAAAAAEQVWTWVAEQAGADPALRGYAASLAFADPRVLWRHARDLVAASGAETLAARRARLAVPLLYVAGDPRGASPRARALLDAAGVEVAAVGPAGHWPFIDQPLAFAEIVARFVERIT